MIGLQNIKLKPEVEDHRNQEKTRRQKEKHCIDTRALQQKKHFFGVQINSFT